MAILLRVATIVIAVLIALLVGGHVLCTVWYAPDWSLLLNYGLPHGSMVAALATPVIFINSVPFVLFALVIVIAERVALRSLPFYLACGLGLTLLVRYDLQVMIGNHLPYDLSARGGLILTATGLSIGLTYWAIAGRKAGVWREKFANPSSRSDATTITD
jgi:hypothetical protein